MIDAKPPLPVADLEHVLELTEALWHELSGEQLFITGGTGFFGIWLLESLAHANDRLDVKLRATVLTRDPVGFAVKCPHLAARTEFRWLAGDVRDFPFPEGEFSQVIHAATPASALLNETHPEEMFDVIVNGTQRVLEFAEKAGTTNFLFSSSGAVCGRQPPELEKIPETYAGAPDPNDPRSAYAEGKRAAELLCAFAQRRGKLAPKIARCFAFVGPHLPLDAHFAIGNFIRDALGHGDIAVEGDGSSYRSYLHAADLVIWLVTILMHGENNSPYNVGSDEAVSIMELAHRVAAQVDREIRVTVLGQQSADRPSRYVPDITRAREELGLEVLIGLDDAVTRTLGWLRDSPRFYNNHQ